jgi:predicted DNA-binding transcriptional regulator AlpA
MDLPTPDKLVSEVEALKRFGIARTTSYHRIKNGMLIPPIKRLSQSKYWAEHEVRLIEIGLIAGYDKEALQELTERLLEQRAKKAELIERFFAEEAKAG